MSRRWIAVTLTTLLWTGEVCAVDLELGGGYTFDRFKTLYDSGVLGARVLTNESGRWPTEWSAGYVLGQDKNASNHHHNDLPVAYLALGKRLRWRWLYAGAGLTAVDQTSQRISTTLNIKTQAGLRVPVARGFGVYGMVQHISNAGLDGENDGETFYEFGLGYRLR